MKQLTQFYLQINRQKDPACRVAADVVTCLTRAGGHIYLDEAYRPYTAGLPCTYTREIPAAVQAILVVGGDGSILDAAPVAAERELPLLGINLGRLGYLAEVSQEEISLLPRLISGEYTISSRMTLSLSILSEDGASAYSASAFNEFAITQESHPGLCDLLLTDTDGNRIRYRGDGLIIATPSGSTAYSFSCGGPVMHPALSAICVTPICPHSFFNRAMVLAGDAEICVQNGAEESDRLCVSADGRSTYLLRRGERILVRRGTRTLSMITFEKHGMMNTLRQKMQDAEMKG